MALHVRIPCFNTGYGHQKSMVVMKNLSVMSTNPYLKQASRIYIVIGNLILESAEDF